MVFMGVADLKNAANMSQEAKDDLAELEKIKTHPGLNIFVQKHDAGGSVERHHIGHGPQRIEPDDTDPRGGKALGRFIASSLVEARHEPQDRSVLVLWGHAYHF